MISYKKTLGFEEERISRDVELRTTNSSLIFYVLSF